MLKEKHILSVSELNFSARALLENQFPNIWVQGEISNLARPSSGHLYFSLKDQGAQIRAAFFRGHAHRSRVELKDGLQVIVRAKVSLYPNRGDYQLIVEEIEDAGFGLLQKAFEELKNKLQKAGLFDKAHKKPIPRYPQKIGIITSTSGAAIRDVLTTLKRRYPIATIILYPCSVQGKTAAREIKHALELANQHNSCDVLILCRGGGSLEDLWPFNEEITAQAIFASQLPVISGVGHEVDITIADFVADLRAATPTAAAELATPNQAELQQSLVYLQQKLSKLILQLLQHGQHTLHHLQKRLRHPRALLQDYQQQLDHFELSLFNIIKLQLQAKQLLLQKIAQHFIPKSLQQQIVHQQQHMKQLQQNLSYFMQAQLNNKQQQLKQLASTLNAVSPLATLQRGYAIVQDATSGDIIRETNVVKIGTQIKAKLAQGVLIATVDEIKCDYSLRSREHPYLG